MESGPGEPEGQGESGVGSRAKLGRAVILQTIRDLGNSDAGGTLRILDWAGSDHFKGLCRVAKWEPDWVYGVIESLCQLQGEDPSVIRRISRDVERIMNGKHGRKATSKRVSD